MLFAPFDGRLPESTPAEAGEILYREQNGKSVQK
jgi:hypothetical protein